MAFLILNDPDTENGEAYESWYDFNPEDPEAINKIETLLANKHPTDRPAIKKVLAELCEASIQEKSAARKKHWFTTLITAIGNLLTGKSRRSFPDQVPISSIPHGKPLQHSSTVEREREVEVSIS